MKVRPCTLHGIEERSTAKISAGGRTGAAMGVAGRPESGAAVCWRWKGKERVSKATLHVSVFYTGLWQRGCIVTGAPGREGDRGSVYVWCVSIRVASSASGARGPQFKAQARLQFSQAHARAHAV